jgi:hypothetical protein
VTPRGNGMSIRGWDPPCFLITSTAAQGNVSICKGVSMPPPPCCPVVSAWPPLGASLLRDPEAFPASIQPEEGPPVLAMHTYTSTDTFCAPHIMRSSSLSHPPPPSRHATSR